MHTVIKRCAILGVACAAVVAGLAVAQADEPVRALWKSQELTFTYQGFTARYTCDGLRDRVRQILLELGARKDIKIYSTGCDIGGAPSPFPAVRLTISTPVEATPENIADLNREPTKKDLIARSTGKRGNGTEATDQFPAQWRTVNFSERNNKLRIQSGECELIEQLRDRLFPKLGIKVVEDHTNCVPYQISLGQPNMKVAALVAAPKPDEAKKN